ncbi:MAG: trehalose-phosphatase [Candidatus Omnitrophota bacterium]
MRYIFNQEITKVLKNKKRLFLFLDYDGTLAAIVRDPGKAKLTRYTRRLLRELTRQEKVVLGIISGRSLSDVKKRVGVNNIFYAGNHGLEILFKGKKILVKEALIKQCRLTLILAKKELRKALKGIKGVVFEDKGVIFAVHYRKVTKGLARVKLIFRRVTAAYLGNRKLKLSAGKKVLEIRPNIAINKFDAVNFLQKRLKKQKDELTIFIGDDLTDEDVFKNLGCSDFGIRVGRKQGSRARYFLKNPQEVNKLLAKILKSKT